MGKGICSTIFSTKTMLALFVVLLSLGMYHLRDALFSAMVPVSMWYYWLPSSLKTCPQIDPEVFRSKIVPVPEITVSSHEECLEAGMKMGHALLCSGYDIDEERIAELILSDPAQYQMRCYTRPEHLTSIVTISGYEFVNATLADIENMPDCYAGFIMGPTHHERLLQAFPNLDPTSPSVDHKADKEKIASGGSLNFATSFLANFRESVVSTSDHAAPVESVVYQLVGEKVFLMYDHARTQHSYTFSKILHPWPSCASDYINNIPEFWVAPVRAGTFLYFPLLWAHTVYTTAGTNIMTNVRITKKEFIMKQSWKKIVGILLTGLMGGSWKKESYNQYLWDADELFDDAASTRMIEGILQSFL